jgi:transcriptional regulator with XRE-family HTH domain
MQALYGLEIDGAHLRKSIHTERGRRLKQFLIQARKDAGLTQVQLAARLRSPQSFVSKYESGERRLDVIEFIDVVKALGADPRRIIDQLGR